MLAYKCFSKPAVQLVVPSRLFGVSSSLKNIRGLTGPVLAQGVTGTVQTYDVAKGYGFIQRDDGQGLVFVHLTSIKGKNPTHLSRTLLDGEPVLFDIMDGEMNGPEAINVTGPNGNPVKGSPLGVYQRSQVAFGVPPYNYNLAASTAGLRTVTPDAVQGAWPGAAVPPPRTPTAAPTASATGGNWYGGVGPAGPYYGAPLPFYKAYGGQFGGRFGGPRYVGPR